MSLISQIYLLGLFFIVSVSARFIGTNRVVKTEEDHTFLPATEAQKEYISKGVCEESLAGYFDFSTEAINKCKENFGWHMDRDVSGMRLRCRTATGVTLELPPSNLYQLVLLVPYDDDDPYSMNYNILNTNSRFTDGLEITSGTNYSVYSTVLDHNGSPLVWHRESDIHAWKVPEQRHYDLRVRYNVTSTGIDGLFSWNRTGELDSCFELDITCQNTDDYIYPTKKIWPGSPPSQVIKNLPPEDSCCVKLQGLYEVIELEFHTPRYKVLEEPQLETNADNTYLEKVHDEEHTSEVSIEAMIDLDSTETPGFLKVPEKPNFTWVDKIQLMAVEDGSTWTVYVRWRRPHVLPEIYNVTLLADDIFTTAVPGDATEAELRGVTGTGIYNVSVDAILGDQIAHNLARAPFPSGAASGAGVVRWALAAGATWLAAALAAALYWLRSCRPRIMPPTKPNKASMDSKPLSRSAEPAALQPALEADAWELRPERLALHEVIGEGAFGVVRRGTLAPLGKEVAVKMLKDFPSTDELRAFSLEMDLMKSVGAHPHVVSLVGCCTTRQPAIVAEYCSRGDLLNFLRCSWDVMVSKRNANYYNNNINTSDYRNDLFKCKMPQEHSRLVVNKLYDLQGVCDTELNSLDLLSFCRQIAMGMEFLTLNKVVHRDLAARNILVTGDRTLKIADFGLSRDVYEKNQYTQKGNGKMPVKWMALESLTRRIYTSQSDVWSFGVVVWEVVTLGGAPYAGVEAARLPRLLRTGYRMPRPPNCSNQLYELMTSCWAARPRERPTFAELHSQLDALLNSASADDYLSLELDDEPPPAPATHRYLRMILRSKRNWTRGESYERPLKAHNHYSSPPVIHKSHT